MTKESEAADSIGVPQPDSILAEAEQLVCDLEQDEALFEQDRVAVLQVAENLRIRSLVRRTQNQGLLRQLLG